MEIKKIKSQRTKRFQNQWQIVRMNLSEFSKSVVLQTLDYIGYILTGVATFLTIAQMIGYKVDYSVVERNIGMRVPFLLFLMLFIALFAVVFAIIKKWPKTATSIVHNDIKIIVECCNIFEQDGFKVIHSTDTFDVDRIMPKSLIGQFVELCSDNNIDIKKHINNNLPMDEYVQTDDELEGLKDRFQLGAVCTFRNVRDSDENILELRKFCLVAVSHLYPGTVKLEVDEYKESLLRMWGNLAKPGIKDDDTINVTVIGNKYLPIPDTYNVTQKIGLMIETFFEVSKKRRVCNTLRICVHSDDMAKINFFKFDAVMHYLSERNVLLPNK